MLHFLRRAVKSLVAKILLGLLIASFAVWGIGDIFTSRGDSAVAQVGDTEVPASRFADALIRTQRILSQQRREAVPLQTLRETGIADATLAGLVRDAALSEELARLEIAVPAAAVRDSIVGNPSFQDGQGAFSQFLYQSRLNESGYDPESYEAATRELLGQQLLVDALTPVAAPPPGAGEMIAAHRGEQRTISFVRLTPDMAPDPGMPDDAALEAFFAANSERFMEPERRSGLFLHTDLAALETELAPTDEEVRAEYDANPDRYTVVPTRDVEQIVFDDMETARAAAERLAAGTAGFAEIAAEQNVPIADLSLGTVTERDLPAATATAVFGVTEPGVVGPVEGPFGPILLNVTAVERGGVAPFEEVAERIRGELAARRAREAAVQRANAIDDARAAGTPLPEIAEQVGVALRRFKGLDPEGRSASDEQPTVANDPAFLAEVGAAIDGEERDLIQLADGSYALVMVEEIVESHLPDLASIRDRVAAAWAEEQRLQALEARATELAGRIAEQGLAAVAAEAGLTAPETASFTRETVPPVLTPALAEAVFAAEPGGALVGRDGRGEAMLLAVLDEVEPLAPDLLAESAAAIDRALVDSLQRDQLEFFGRAVEALHGATVNRGTIEQVFEQLGQSGR